jgi:hypothetical protein
MKTKEKMDFLRNKIEVLDKINIEQQQEIYKLKEEYEKLLSKRILEDNLLNIYTWNICFSMGKIILEAKEKDDGRISELSLDCDYHMYFELKEGILFRSDDGYISITFDDNNLIKQFLEQYKINISSSNNSIKTRKENIMEELSELEKLESYI